MTRIALISTPLTRLITFAAASDRVREDCPLLAAVELHNFEEPVVAPETSDAVGSPDREDRVAGEEGVTPQGQGRRAEHLKKGAWLEGQADC